MSNFLSLNWRDVGKGLGAAVLIAVGELFLQLIRDKGLNITTADIWPLLDTALKIGGGYLFVTFFSTKEGKFLGAI